MSQLICVSDRCTQHRLISDIKDIKTHIEDRHELMNFDNFKEEWWQIQKQVRDFRSLKQLLKGSIAAMKKQLDELLYGLDERFLQIDDRSSNLELDFESYGVQEALHLYKQFQDLKQDKKDMNDFITLDLQNCFEKFTILYGHLYNKLGVVNTIIDAIDKQKSKDKYNCRQITQMKPIDDSNTQFKTNSGSLTQLEQQQYKTEIFVPLPPINTSSNNNDTLQLKQSAQSSTTDSISNPFCQEKPSVNQGQNQLSNQPIWGLNSINHASQSATENQLGCDTPQFKSNTSESGWLQKLETGLKLQKPEQDHTISFNFSNSLNPFYQERSEQTLDQNQDRQSNRNQTLNLLNTHDQPQEQINNSIFQGFLSSNLFTQTSTTQIQETKTLFRSFTQQSNLGGFLGVNNQENPFSRIGCEQKLGGPLGCEQKLEGRLGIEPQIQVNEQPPQRRQKQKIGKQVKFDTILSEQDITYIDKNAKQVNLYGKKYLICDESFMITGASKLELLIIPKQESTKIMIGLVCLERWKESSIEKYRRTGETVSNKGNPYLSLIKWKISEESLFKIKFQNKEITFNGDQTFDLSNEGFSDDDEVAFFLESQQCILKIK